MTRAIYILLNEKLKNLENWRMLNTVFMLGTVLGKRLDDSCFGPSVMDASGISHAGIGNIVLPILSVKEEAMIHLYKMCKERETPSEFEVIDFTLAAQNSRVYDEYANKLSAEKLEDQTLLGIALFGDAQKLKSVCGNLPRWK